MSINNNIFYFLAILFSFSSCVFKKAPDLVESDRLIDLELVDSDFVSLESISFVDLGFWSKTPTLILNNDLSQFPEYQREYLEVELFAVCGNISTSHELGTQVFNNQDYCFKYEICVIGEPLNCSSYTTDICFTAPE